MRTEKIFDCQLRIDNKKGEMICRHDFPICPEHPVDIFFFFMESVFLTYLQYSETSPEKFAEALAEYAKSGRLRKALQEEQERLAGIPSAEL